MPFTLQRKLQTDRAAMSLFQDDELVVHDGRHLRVTSMGRHRAGGVWVGLGGAPNDEDVRPEVVITLPATVTVYHPECEFCGAAPDSPHEHGWPCEANQ